MLLGGYVGEEQIHFGEKALRLPAKNAPEAAVRVVGRFADEREAGETFRGWMDRSGGAKAIADDAQGPRRVPHPRRGTRVLRRLRRDRALRRRDRRLGVRDMSDATVFTGTGADGFDASRSRPTTSPTPSWPSSASSSSACRPPRSSSGRSTTSRRTWPSTASMTDAVLIDLAVKVDPAIEVVFIDTGYHFPETLETVEEVRRRYGLNMQIMTVARQDEELWKVDPENCCSAVKVGQLDRALPASRRG